MVDLEALLILISLIVPTQAFHKLSSSPSELFFPPLLISFRQDCALVLYLTTRMDWFTVAGSVPSLSNRVVRSQSARSSVRSVHDLLLEQVAAQVDNEALDQAFREALLTFVKGLPAVVAFLGVTVTVSNVVGKVWYRQIIITGSVFELP